MTTEQPGIEASVLLCDAAQVVGGKLYILGGGWSQVVSVAPLTMALAIKLAIPWDLANKRLKLFVRLLTQDGDPVSASPSDDAADARVEFLGGLEVGRAPGLPEGSPLDAVLAIPIQGLTLTGGGYVWEISVEDSVLQRAPFRVLEAPPNIPTA